ncbi:MAG: DAK2 domain-containing protein [Mycoplasmataceae bacterium]|jgi:DAK2 domain fusion protein YloV|nr:DAK2 domain-containing protein [Mycoplasmataceae bacterium]
MANGATNKIKITEAQIKNAEANNKEVIIQTIDVSLLKSMFIGGCEELAKHYQYIDELNVFPVPDGDTGTNMKITFEGAINVIKGVEYKELFLLGKQFSRGLLMNARGNSGVISSQIFKGFTSGFKEGEFEISIPQFVDCFNNAKQVAYNAVSSPVEGTILTIIRVISEELEKKRNSFTSINAVFKYAIKIGEETLLKTPDMLPELKEVGVVDSGGYGLCKFLHGMYEQIDHRTAEVKRSESDIDLSNVRKSFIPSLKDNNEGFGYCNEFIMTVGSKVEFNQPDKLPFEFENFKSELEKMGDSLVIVIDENIVKVHIHSTKPYEILQFASQFGEFNKVKIENMTMQFLERNPGTTLESLHNKNVNKGFDNLSNDIFVIATVPSLEFADLYQTKFNISTTINTDAIGNPSVQDFIDAIKKTKSSKIFIVLDDSNFALSAIETVKLLPKTVEATLLKANNIVDSYNACLAFDPTKSYEENKKILNRSVGLSKVLKVAKSVKDVQYSHINIAKGEYIGIIEKKIVSSDLNLFDATNKLLDYADAKKYKKAIVFYGENMLANDANTIANTLKQKYAIDAEIINGGQSKHYFIIGLAK